MCLLEKKSEYWHQLITYILHVLFFLAEFKTVKEIESGLDLNGFVDVYAVAYFLEDLEMLCHLY